ncbi:MAG: hypothetical protein R3F21_08985 [Myxococcota bacterium]
MPYSHSKVVANAHALGTVSSEQYEDAGVRIRASVRARRRWRSCGPSSQHGPDPA